MANSNFYTEIEAELNRKHEQRRRNEAAADKEREYKARLKKSTAYNKAHMLEQQYGTAEY